MDIDCLDGNWGGNLVECDLKNLMPESARSELVRVGSLEVGYRGGSFRLTVPDFVLRSEEAIAILGRSGTGKSTLLRALLNLDTGLEMAPADAMRWTRHPRFGHVAQEDALLPWRSALGNAAFGCGAGRDSILSSAVALRLLQEVGLENASSKYPDELSGGMARRLTLAVALAQEPDVLLMDEPLGALDPSTKAGIVGVIQAYQRRSNCASIIVSHDYREVVVLAERVYDIDKFGVLYEVPFRSEAFGQAFGLVIASQEAQRLYDIVEAQRERREK